MLPGREGQRAENGVRSPEDGTGAGRGRHGRQRRARPSLAAPPWSSAATRRPMTAGAVDRTALRGV